MRWVRLPDAAFEKESPEPRVMETFDGILKVLREELDGKDHV